MLGWVVNPLLLSADGRITLRSIFVPAFVTGPIIFGLMHGLATWLVLQRRVNSLRLWHWLVAAVGGFLLSGACLLPALVFGIPFNGFDLLELNVYGVDLLAGWLTVIVSGVALVLPPGWLLQRLTGASAWPFVVAGVLATMTTRLAPSWTALLPWVAELGFRPTQHDWLVVLAFAASLVFGAVFGLMMGAGLFVMARRSRTASPPGA
jgi:hypothetical protein